MIRDELPAAPVLVLDTNVVLDWLVFADPSIDILGSWIEAGLVTLVTRADCRAELVRVLDYPRVPVSETGRAEALAHYDRLALCFSGPGKTTWIPQCRDPDDQKFLELARDTCASWLVTKDKLLLALSRQTRERDLFLILHPRQLEGILGP